MVVGVVCLDGQEGAGADVQRQRLVADAGGAQRGDQIGREVQRRRGRGDGARFSREHRLVIVGIARIGRALGGDIGRQRHAAGAFEQQFDRLVPREVEREAAILAAIGGDGGDARSEIDAVAVTQTARVADESAPAARSFALVQRRADLRLAASPLELRGDHARVVEHQAVAGTQFSRQVANDAVARRIAVEHQQPCRIARRCRPQRDPLGRQLEIEKLDLHLRAGAFLAGAVLRAGATAFFGAAVPADSPPGNVTGAPSVTGAGAGAGV